MRLIDAEYLLYGMGMFSERENGAEFMKGAEAVAKMIEEAETVHEPDDCTPCAEGLPVPKDGVYDVTLNNRNETFGVVTAYVLDGEWVNTGMYTIENIIAYMPKPAPYRADQKGESADDHK